MLAVVGVVSALLLFGLIVGIQVLYFEYQQTVDQQQAARVPNVEAKNLITEQEAKLQQQGWLDREQGKIAIPIERAMKLVVEEMQSRQRQREG
jgi:hypothetical protein